MIMSKHTLLIHIGIRKTGSSALQAFLYENMEKLEEYGWCYPDFSQKLFGIPSVAQRGINGGVFYKERGNLDTESENWIKGWELILKLLENKNVIISEERISIWNTSELLAAAKEKYDNIKVIIYLRRQDRAVESIWNQMVKNPVGCHQTFREFIHWNDGKECAPYHYKKQLDEISEIIGKENLIVRVYEKSQLSGGCTESDFLSVLGIEPDWNEWNKNRDINLRLDINYLEIKRILNSLQLIEGNETALQQYWTVFGELSHIFGDLKEEKGYFTFEERKEFLDQFVFENELIAKEYLLREDGILFFDDVKDIPIYVSPCTPFEEEMIRSLGVLICRQGKEIQRLINRENNLAEKLLQNNVPKGKKIILFGAGQKCIDLLFTLKLPIVLIADNDKEKDGKSLKGIPIIYAKDIKNWSDFFVIITCVESEEIENQLENEGLKKEVGYVLAKEYFACY